jgi:YD repeat-containing protein
MMARKSFLFVLLIVFALSSDTSAQHTSTGSDSKIAQYVKLASELTSRARANVYFANAQDIFRGVQFNYVNVGFGNLTFLRRDIVASGRIPIVFARVYDSIGSGSADFGPGWMLSATETISIENHTARLLSENGSVFEFAEAEGGIFTLAKGRASDYLQLRRTAPGTIQIKLRTGFLKEFKLFNERFFLTKVTDRNGNEVHLIYKDSGLLRIENANHFIELKRNNQGKLISAQDDQGRQVHYRYDAKGRLVEAEDLGGATWSYTYTDDNKLKTVLDPMKRLNFEVSYDDAGRVRRIKQPSGLIQYNYNPLSHSTIVIDRKELVSRYFQNEEGVTVRIVNPLGEETAISLDDARNVLSLSRNGSIVQSMDYDEQHRIISRHAVTGTEPINVSYKDDPVNGALIGIDSGNGLAKTFGYDRNGNLSSAVTDEGLHRYGFSPSGDLATYSASGLDLTFAPDSDGQIGLLKDAKDTTSLEYKTGGELSEVSFADGRKANYEYQASGLRAKLVYKDGRHTEYSYDSAGNLISTKIFDEKGKQVQGQKLFLNDSYQVIKRLLFDGTEEAFEYDPNGNLTKHTKNGAVTRFEYDELNRLVAVLTPAGEHLTYSYTPGERSLVEQYEHSSTSVADLIDTGFTFASAWQVFATRPLTAPFGPIRFSEPLGTFQLANADGTEVLTPETTIEQALQKLNLVVHAEPLKQRQNLFNRPFNTMFMPAEYASINCCFSCSDGSQCRSGLTDGTDTTSCCPPCDPPRPVPVADPPPPPVPTSLKVLSANLISSDNLRGCDPATNFAIVIAIKYQVLDQNGNALASASMEPQERIINFFFDGFRQPDPVPLPIDVGPTQYPGTSKFTDANGQFIDAPFGQCTSAAFTNTFDQPITVIFNGSTYAVRTNSWTIQSASVGQGFISNGNDIKQSK